MQKIQDSSWSKILNPEFEKGYFHELSKFIDEERKQYIVFPSEEQVFNAFVRCDFENVKVVILGQDPYHGVGQANGLSFSVNDGIKFPPSLRNIFKELNRDFETKIPASGNLERWAEQGVLLLNATLTVRSGEAGSHQNKGWEIFTDAVINKLSQYKSNLVFLLWGSYAQKKKSLIDQEKHLILESAHPSPLSAHRGFLGNNHFSLTNKYLEGIGEDIIAW